MTATSKSTVIEHEERNREEMVFKCNDPEKKERHMYVYFQVMQVEKYLKCKKSNRLAYATI